MKTRRVRSVFYATAGSSNLITLGKTRTAAMTLMINITWDMRHPKKA